MDSEDDSWFLAEFPLVGYSKPFIVNGPASHPASINGTRFSGTRKVTRDLNQLLSSEESTNNFFWMTLNIPDLFWLLNKAWVKKTIWTLNRWRDVFTSCRISEANFQVYEFRRKLFRSDFSILNQRRIQTHFPTSLLTDRPRLERRELNTQWMTAHLMNYENVLESMLTGSTHFTCLPHPQLPVLVHLSAPHHAPPGLPVPPLCAHCSGPVWHL